MVAAFGPYDEDFDPFDDELDESDIIISWG
jgi:hypothetical protein